MSTRTTTSSPPMKAATRGRRPPGFVARAALPPVEASDAPVDTRDQTAAAAMPVRERTPAPATAPATAKPSDPPRDPYAGAPSRQYNTRLLEPLHSRYVQLVRDLEDEGYRTTMTEIVHALLDAGPTAADDARELVRAYRRKREP